MSDRPKKDQRRRDQHRRDQHGRDQHGTDGPVADLLLRSGRFFSRSEVSSDLRTISKSGGRQCDVFYRDLWSHD